MIRVSVAHTIVFLPCIGASSSYLPFKPTVLISTTLKSYDAFVTLSKVVGVAGA
jgi:hypothetical protein